MDKILSEHLGMTKKLCVSIRNRKWGFSKNNLNRKGCMQKETLSSRKSSSK